MTERHTSWVPPPPTGKTALLSRIDAIAQAARELTDDIMYGESPEPPFLDASVADWRAVQDEVAGTPDCTWTAVCALAGRSELEGIMLVILRRSEVAREIPPATVVVKYIGMAPSPGNDKSHLSPDEADRLATEIDKGDTKSMSLLDLGLLTRTAGDEVASLYPA